MKKFTRFPAFLLIILISFQQVSAQNKKLTQEITQTMLRATKYMVEEVSYKGGYVWNYTPDLKRLWGEMEAKPTMIWTQAPGTPSMGHLFLDAYQITGDEYYYNIAEDVAKALIWGQLDCGGWNYIIDFAGEASLKEWYETIGKNGWRLEEFKYYYGNATFDDDATIGPATFLLRIYNEKHDPVFKPALDKAIDFVLESQYKIGGWPQRYPLKYDHPNQYNSDYSSYITLNDDVHKGNVMFLIMCYQSLGDARLLEPIRRAMNCIMILQQGSPQPGWSWQFTTDLKPAGARTYEPEGLYSGATYSCANLMMDYYEFTGETKFLARVPEAISFLESIELPSEMYALFPRKPGPNQKLYPSCIEIGTNKPLYVHRRGSNAINGEFYSDYDPANQWMPTFSMRTFDIGQLKNRYQKLKLLSPEEASKDSPLKDKTGRGLPQYFSGTPGKISSEEVKSIIEALNTRPYWEGVFADSNPYIADGPAEAAEGDFSCTQVGDKYDTSPYRFGEDFKGITTRDYIVNMFKLIGFLNEN